MGRYNITIQDTHNANKETTFSKDAVVMVRSEIVGAYFDKENPDKTRFDLREDVFVAGHKNQQEVVERLLNGVMSLCFRGTDKEIDQLNVCAVIKAIIRSAGLSGKVTFEIGEDLMEKQKEVMSHVTLYQ